MRNTPLANFLPILDSLFESPRLAWAQINDSPFSTRQILHYVYLPLFISALVLLFSINFAMSHKLLRTISNNIYPLLINTAIFYLFLLSLFQISQEAAKKIYEAVGGNRIKKVIFYSAFPGFCGLLMSSIPVLGKPIFITGIVLQVQLFNIGIKSISGISYGKIKKFYTLILIQYLILLPIVFLVAVVLSKLMGLFNLK